MRLRPTPTGISGAILLVAALVALRYIDHANDRIRELEELQDEQAHSLRQLERDVEDLEEAEETLRGTVRRFQSEDWSQVVPAVESAAFDTERATQAVASRMKTIQP